MNIYLSKKYITGDWSDEAVAVYIALRKILRRDEPTCYVTLNMIYYALWGKFERQKTNQRIMDSIKSGLNELINLGLVSYEEVLSSFEYVLDLSKLELDTSKAIETKDFFVIVQDTEIHTIMNGDSQHKFKLCRYFVFLVGTFNNKTQVGFSPL
jgi:hypothetical protein